ncbi:actin maturation protease-like [Taeniopygia guttata]|uniref:actin maturation protease-like n=1 Tax=Taeniopygia guttata TaxID=59729 RepID=UPI003BB91F1F
MERSPPPPPPPPPPLPGTSGSPSGTPGSPSGTPGSLPGSGPGLERVLREALQRAAEALGEDGGIRELLRRRRDSLAGPWKWLLFHRPVPPLIQDGPQCGLVALAMAGAVLAPTRPQLSLGALLETARARGYTRQGETFSAAQLAALAQELLPCRAELLQGGLGGHNRARILRHLLRGHLLLVPYTFWVTSNCYSLTDSFFRTKASSS